MGRYRNRNGDLFLSLPLEREGRKEGRKEGISKE
jgi:hypothetical protein